MKKASNKLTGKYAKLRDDLLAAVKAGCAAEARSPEDGGTYNLDAVSIYLPRWRSALIEQAAKEAGTYCTTSEMLGKTRYVFLPVTRSRGNARSRNAEAMEAVLRKMGYEAINYCAMD